MHSTDGRAALADRISVYLRRGDLSRLTRGHPWVFASEIDRASGEPQAGDAVDVLDPRGAPLGWGFFSPASRIAVRRLAVRPDARPFQVLARERIAASRDLRRRTCSGATCFRVVSSEADFLPGLLVDLYEDRVVFQTLTAGMDRRKDEILAAIDDALSPRVIVERNDAAVRSLEGLAPLCGVVRGTEQDARFEVDLDGVRLGVDLLTGHKGGLYLDQRVNHRLVAAHARGARVLDAFSYHGGFALHCAAAGAASVCAVEISDSAVRAAQTNVGRNGAAGVVSVVEANAFDFLKSADAAAARAATRPYDLVILDPPSFTRSRSSVGAAARGYKEIHLRACRLLGPGGRLATFCCSHHVSRDAFERIVVDAAADARRTIRRAESYRQPPDHPVLPAIPETEYLKGFLFEIVE